MAGGKRARTILFRIFYSTSFTAFFLLLIAFICVTPADAVYASYRRDRLRDIFLITGAYVITAILAALFYASRLFTNRSVLKEIPKTFMPIEKEDLPGRRIRRVIQEGLERSAVVAYQAKPRARRIEEESSEAGGKVLKLMKSEELGGLGLEPKWGVVNHPGWASPANRDLPGLEYQSVIDELVDLIEAKAVSLAPLDLLATPDETGEALPDQTVIEVLSRPQGMGMRGYLSRLIELGVVPETSLSVAFLASYERARFGAQPLTEADFQALMRMFAELLRSMVPIDPETISLDDPEDNADERSFTDYSSSGKSTFSDSGSVRHKKNVGHDLPPRRISEDSAAPSMSEEDEIEVRSPPPPPATSATRSASRPTVSSMRMYSAASRPSVRRTGSNMTMQSSRSSRSNGSVIRLAGSADRRDLPYTIQIPRIETS